MDTDCYSDRSFAERLPAVISLPDESDVVGDPLKTFLGLVPVSLVAA